MPVGKAAFHPAAGPSSGCRGWSVGTQRAARPVRPSVLSPRFRAGGTQEEGGAQMWGKAEAPTDGGDLAALQIPWVLQQPVGAARTSRRLNLYKDTLRV